LKRYFHRYLGCGGTTYYYKVTALTGASESARSIEAAAAVAPPAPVGVNAVGGSGQVTLNWSVAAGATGYNVFRGTSASGEDSSPINATALAAPRSLTPM